MPRPCSSASKRRSPRCRKVEGGNGQLYLAQPLAKVFATAEEMAKKAGDSFVTVERLLHGAGRREIGQDRRHPGQGRRDARRR